MFVSLSLTHLFNQDWTYYKDWTKSPKLKGVKWNTDFKWLNDEDSYLVIFSKGKEYALMYEKLIKDERFKILFQGDAAVNFNHEDDDNPRNILVVFEKKCDKEQVPAQDVEKTGKTPEGIILSTSKMEETIAFLADITPGVTDQNYW